MTSPKTERQLERLLADKLGLAAVPPGLWHELRDRGYVRDALDAGDKEGLLLLLDQARSYQRAAIGPVVRTSRGRARRRAANSLITTKELRRAEAFSVFLAKRAETDRVVAGFRNDVLCDRILSEPEALALICSPAPYLLDPAELRRLEIPAKKYRAKVEHRREETREGTSWRERVVLRLWASGRATTHEFVIARAHGDGMWLEIPTALWGRATPFGRGDVEPFVRPSSAFDQLRRASNWLTQRFPWEPWEAVWFVLTNTPPFVPPIRTGIRRSTRQSESGEMYRQAVITLEVDPWMTAPSVLRVYRSFQREMLGGRNRGLAAKALDLFRFVTERAGALGRLSKWDELRIEWNRTHRNRTYGDYRNFRRDFERARKAILLPEERTIRVPRLW